MGDEKGASVTYDEAMDIYRRTGDLNPLCKTHEGLVKSQAKLYLRPGIEMDDLVQEGYMGLCRAAQKYDPSRGAKFSTYAVRWIRSFAWRYVRNKTQVVKGRSVNGYSGWVDIYSLSAPIRLGNGDAIEMSSGSLESTEQALECHILHDRVVGSRKVPKRTKLLILGHFVNNYSYRELGRAAGLSGERVRQIIEDGLRVLRLHLSIE